MSWGPQGLKGLSLVGNYRKLGRIIDLFHPFSSSVSNLEDYATYLCLIQYTCVCQILWGWMSRTLAFMAVHIGLVGTRARLDRS